MSYYRICIPVASLAQGSKASPMVQVFAQFLFIFRLSGVEGLHLANGDAAIIDARSPSSVGEAAHGGTDSSPGGIIHDAADTKYLIIGQDGEFDPIKKESFVQKNPAVGEAASTGAAATLLTEIQNLREETLARGPPELGSRYLPVPIERTIAIDSGLQEGIAQGSCADETPQFVHLYVFLIAILILAKFAKL